MAEDDDLQKTEEPSEKRLEEARQKGQNFSSKEISNFFILFAFTISIISISPKIFKDLAKYLSLFIENSYQLNFTDERFFKIVIVGFTRSYFIIIVPLLLSIIAIIMSSYIQHGEIRLSAESMIPKLEKLSPFKGFSRIMSITSIVEFIKNLFKFILIGIICYICIESKLKYIKTLHEHSIAGYIKFLYNIIEEMLIKLCIAMAFLAGIDYFYQRFSFYKSMRMSKQDLKEEYKQAEGSPEIKSRIRTIRMERAKKRMMSQVPKSSVVITNPTHFAVALKYEIGDIGAPVVMAKGKDLIALKIKEIAKNNNIPIVENPPLARVLFSSVEIDKQIPAEHYKAVAEIINYVYRLRKRL